MATPKRKIAGIDIPATSAGFQVTSQLADLSPESKVVKVTLGAGVEHVVTLPTGAGGVEIETGLADVLATVGATVGAVPSAVTNNPVEGADWETGVLIPQSERRAFNVSGGDLRLKSATGGAVTIHSF